jgi:hypothetical protein
MNKLNLINLPMHICAFIMGILTYNILNTYDISFWSIYGLIISSIVFAIFCLLKYIYIYI